MNILALDTADQVLSAALETGNGIFYTETDAGARHSELLMECADGLCKTAGLNPADIGLAACMKGPGSFTGLRIGFSAAKGLCLALGIPLLAVPTLDCLAYPFSEWPGLVLPAIDAKKGCFFAALYRGGTRLTDDMDATPEILARETARVRLSAEELLLLTGSGAELLGSRLAALIPPEYTRFDPEPRRGKARELLEIVKNGIIIEYDKFSDINGINTGPVYLRKSDAELNWN